MTPQQLLAVGVRLFAIWLALSSIAYFSAIPAALADSVIGSGAPTKLAYVMGTGYALCAALLWCFPMLVAHKLLPRTAHTNFMKPETHEVARVGCALLGLWLLARALPAFAWLFFKALLFNSAGSTYAALAVESKVEIAVAGFEVVLGLLLLIKASVFARALIPDARQADAPGDNG